jgi:hypothetical protein
MSPAKPKHFSPKGIKSSVAHRLRPRQKKKTARGNLTKIQKAADKRAPVMQKPIP